MTNLTMMRPVLTGIGLVLMVLVGLVVWLEWTPGHEGVEIRELTP